MHRRTFITGMAMVAAAPLGAEAQQVGKVWRVGLVCANFCESTAASTVRPMTGLLEALYDAGYVDGKNHNPKVAGSNPAPQPRRTRG
jgi:hypothetical protein